MLVFFAMLLIAASLVAVVLVIYDLYCIFGARQFNKKVAEEGKSALENSSKLNIIVWLAKKSKTVKNLKKF